MKAFQGENIYKVQTFSLYLLFKIDGLFLYSAGFFRYKFGISYFRVFVFAVHSQSVLASIDESRVEGQRLSPSCGVVERQPAVLGNTNNHAENRNPCATFLS